MMRSASVVGRWVMRPTGIAQVILGLLFWLGFARGLIMLHMALGLVFVLSVWALAAMGLLAGVNRALVLLTAIWGGMVLWLGMSQGRLLPGPYHWAIRVLHLAVGIAAMALGRKMAMMTVRRSAAVPPSPTRLQAAS